MSLVPGTRLGPYEIVALIGHFVMDPVRTVHVVVADIVQRAAVRMIERGNRARLAVKSFADLGRDSRFAQDDLHGHDAVQPSVPGFVDLPPPRR